MFKNSYFLKFHYRGEDDSIKDRVLDIISNELSQEGVKIIFSSEGLKILYHLLIRQLFLNL